MIRKGPPKNNKLNRIEEVTQTEVPHQTATFSPSIKNRVNLSAVITRQASKKNGVSHINFEEENIKQKETVIKQLQQQITLKKQQNDAVQEAFRVRQQYTSFFNKTEQPQRGLRSIALGCAQAASYNKTFKAALFKQLKLVFRQWRWNRVKAVKFLLLWLMGWINGMFNMLGKSLSV